MKSQIYKTIIETQFCCDNNGKTRKLISVVYLISGYIYTYVSISENDKKLNYY